MADKKLEISGKISLEAGQATKALDEISKKFKGLEKSGSNKMFEDFRKIKPIIKELDKDLGRMMSQMAKADAGSRIKELNKGLGEQAKLLKDLVKQKENLEYASFKAMTTERKAAIQNKIEEKNLLMRATMEKMEEGATERRELQKTQSAGFATKLIGAGAFIAGAGQVIGSGMQYFGGAGLRNMQYGATGDSTENRLFDMMRMSNSLQGGYLAANRKGGSYLDRIKGVAGEAGSSTLGGKGVEIATGALGSTMAGATGAIAIGGALAPVTGGLSVPVTAAAGATVGLAGYLLSNKHKADQILPGTEENYAKSVKSEKMTSGIDAVLASAKMHRDVALADMYMGEAPAKMAALEAMGGGESAMYRNLGIASRYGVDMGEALSSMSAVGQSGLIGAERMGGNGVMEAMMNAKASGKANVGQYTSLLSGMTGISGNAGGTGKMLEMAVAKGTKAGVDVSMVKNLVKATEEIASSTGVQYKDVGGVMDLLTKALGGKNGGNVGIADIEGAKAAINARQGATGTQLGAAIGFTAIQDSMTKAGLNANGLSIASKGVLMNATSKADIMNNPAMLDALMQAGGGSIDPKTGKPKLNKSGQDFLNNFDDMKTEVMLRGQMGWSATARDIMGEGGVEGHRGRMASKDKKIKAAEQERLMEFARERMFVLHESAAQVAGEIGIMEGKTMTPGEISKYTGSQGTGSGHLSKALAAMHMAREKELMQGSNIDEKTGKMKIDPKTGKPYENMSFYDEMNKAIESKKAAADILQQQGMNPEDADKMALQSSVDDIKESVKSILGFIAGKTDKNKEHREQNKPVTVAGVHGELPSQQTMSGLHGIGLRASGL